VQHDQQQSKRRRSKRTAKGASSSPLIPGTKRFNEFLLQRTYRRAKEDIERYADLMRPLLAENSEFSRAIRHQLVRLAQSEARREVLSADVYLSWRNLLLCVMLAAVISSVVLSAMWLDFGPSWKGWVLAIALYPVMLMAVGFAWNVLVWAFTYIVSFSSFLRDSILSVVLSIFPYFALPLSTYIAFNGTSPEVRPFEFAICSALLFWSLSMFIIMPILLPLAIVAHNERKRLSTSYPAAYVTGRLLSILYALEKESNRVEPRSEQQILNAIEGIAACIEQDLYHRLRSGDRLTDAWLKDTAIQITTAVRDIKKLVLTPKSGDHELLQQRLHMMLSHAVSRRWGSLERMQPQEISPSQRLGMVKRGLSSVLSAALPAFLLWWIQRTPSLALEGQTANYATLGVFVWAGVNLLLAIDPLAKEKVAALKDITSLLPLPGKPK
jgi:hypothetical protein